MTREDRSVNSRVGKMVKDILDKKGLNQIYLYEKTGVSYSQISKIINGHVSPNASTLEAFAKALDVPVSAFYSDDAKAEVLTNRAIDKLSVEVLDALTDSRNIDWIMLGLGLKGSVLSPDEIRVLVHQYEGLYQRVKKANKSE